MSFSDRLTTAVRKTAPIVVGLDPHLDLLPSELRRVFERLEGADRRAAAAEAAQRFCLGALEALSGKVGVIKPQVAFFEALGAPGVAALAFVVQVAKQMGFIVLLDAKRGDIGSTAKAYAQATLADDGPMGADAVTLSPYLGAESLMPFVEHCSENKGAFILIRTSNPGAGAWQEGIAGRVADWITAENRLRLDERSLGPLGAVVAATLPEEAHLWRKKLPHSWLLVPGYGAQGATAADVRQHFRPDGLGALVAASRSILFGNDGPSWPQAIAERAEQMVLELKAAAPNTQ